MPISCIEYDNEKVPISMELYSIHGCNILSMDLNNLWVACNKYKYRLVPSTLR